MAKTRPLRVLLIRAGSTEWEVAGRLCGATDLPLCEVGRAQLLDDLAAAQADAAPVELSVILAAEDDASRATAQVIADSVVPPVKVRAFEGLSEVGLGLWEGRLGRDLLERNPTAFKRWLDDPTSVDAPEGEAFAEGAERILTGLGRALEKFRDTTKPVGVVLRPLALGIVRAALAGRDTAEAGAMGRDAPRFEWHALTPEAVRALRQPKLERTGAA